MRPVGDVPTGRRDTRAIALGNMPVFEPAVLERDAHDVPQGPSGARPRGARR